MAKKKAKTEVIHNDCNKKVEDCVCENPKVSGKEPTELEKAPIKKSKEPEYLTTKIGGHKVCGYVKEVNGKRVLTTKEGVSYHV